MLQCGARGGGGGENVAFGGGKLILSAAIGLDTRKSGIVALHSTCLLTRETEPQGRLAENIS